MIKNANINPDTVVYMDYGTEELPRYKHMIQKFAMISSMLMKKNIRLNSRIVPMVLIVKQVGKNKFLSLLKLYYMKNKK